MHTCGCAFTLMCGYEQGAKQSQRWTMRAIECRVEGNPEVQVRHQMHQTISTAQAGRSSTRHTQCTKWSLRHKQGGAAPNVPNHPSEHKQGRAAPNAAPNGLHRSACTSKQTIARANMCARTHLPRAQSGVRALARSTGICACRSAHVLPLHARSTGIRACAGAHVLPLHARSTHRSAGSAPPSASSTSRCGSSRSTPIPWRTW